MSWQDRISDMPRTPVDDPPWGDVWTLVSHALAVRGIEWLEAWMWRWRFSGWILALDETSTCTVCGDALPTNHARRTSCSRACRQARVRHRASSSATPWEDAVACARAMREDLQRELEHAHKWVARNAILQRVPDFVPPDWTAMRHPPMLPSRCGSPCATGEACAHTGGACLFASCGRTE